MHIPSCSKHLEPHAIEFSTVEISDFLAARVLYPVEPPFSCLTSFLSMCPTRGMHGGAEDKPLHSPSS